MTIRLGRGALAALGLMTGLGAASPSSADEAKAALSGTDASYVNGFCLSAVAGSSSVEALRSNLQAFDARPGSSAEADMARPIGVELAGQLFRFHDKAAPLAFVDHRRSACALVYDGVDLPASVMDDIRIARLPVGPDGAMVGWRKVRMAFAGRPRPPKYFLQIGESGGFGVCAEINTDLRRRDQSSASVVQLYGCRIGTDERLENG